MTASLLEACGRFSTQVMFEELPDGVGLEPSLAVFVAVGEGPGVLVAPGVDSEYSR